MNLAAVGEAAGVLVALATVIGLYLSTRDSARRRADQERKERQDLADQSFLAGAKSRDDEVALLRSNAAQAQQTAEQDKALLRSQRDDARRDRDAASARADEFERRYNDLRDRRG